MYPSEKLENVTKVMEKEFIEFYGTFFSTQDKIFDKLTNIICL